MKRKHLYLMIILTLTLVGATVSIFLWKGYRLMAANLLTLTSVILIITSVIGIVYSLMLSKQQANQVNHKQRLAVFLTLGIIHSLGSSFALTILIVTINIWFDTTVRPDYLLDFIGNVVIVVLPLVSGILLLFNAFRKQTPKSSL